jgi:hypothetical protein
MYEVNPAPIPSHGNTTDADVATCIRPRDCRIAAERCRSKSRNLQTAPAFCVSSAPMQELSLRGIRWQRCQQESQHLVAPCSALLLNTAVWRHHIDRRRWNCANPGRGKLDRRIVDITIQDRRLLIVACVVLLVVHRYKLLARALSYTQGISSLAHYLPHCQQWSTIIPNARVRNFPLATRTIDRNAEISDRACRNTLSSSRRVRASPPVALLAQPLVQ